MVEGQHAVGERARVTPATQTGLQRDRETQTDGLKEPTFPRMHRHSRASNETLHSDATDRNLTLKKHVKLQRKKS